MPTFLATDKMDPALRARVERAVTGSAGKSPRTMRRIVAFARFGLVLAIAVGIQAYVTGRQRDREAVARLKADLLERSHPRASEFSESARPLSDVGDWVMKLSAPDFAETVDGELRVAGALKARLDAPLVWLRVPLGADAINSADASRKDALLLCLLDPPSLRTEKALLERVRTVQLGGFDLEEHTGHAYRFHDMVAGIPFLLPGWSERVTAASEQNELVALRRDWDRAPIERAIHAAQAGQLLLALDEPGDGNGPTELDGERPHFVRVALVDMSTRKIWFALRRHVDPAWISEPRRPTHASGLDSCALGFDIHEAVRKR
jgi:hypothetical protein